MKKIRALLVIIIVGIVSFFSYRCIKRLLEFLKLSKTLPEYLRDRIGVKPVVHCSLFLPMKLELKVGLAKEIKEREKDLHDVIESYVNDFYPELAMMNIEIKVYELKNEKKKRDVEK